MANQYNEQHSNTSLEFSENEATNSDVSIDIYMSDGSSNFEDGEEIIFPEELTNQPYLFEPEADTDSDEPDLQHDLDHTLDQEFNNRVGNTTWCKCDHCESMETQDESCCCKEVGKIQEKMQDFGHLKCIVEHPGFHSVCLNPFVLETAYYVYRQYHHRDLENSNKRQRYVAYRQLVRWCWGWLGKNLRVPLPSCAVNLIRTTFPCDDDEDYIGFNPPM